MSLIDELKAKNQIFGQTQNIQELYTIQPEKWITLYKWTEDITKRIQRIDYKVSEQISKEDISEYFERRDFRDKNEIGDTDDEISRGIEKTTKSKSETYIQRNTNWNSNRYVSNTTLDTLVTLAYLLNTNRQNCPHRHKRKIRSFRNLSKRAQKEWIKLHKNSSTIDWYEEDEYEM